SWQLDPCEPMMLLSRIHRKRLSYSCLYPVDDPHVTIFPPRLATYTDAPNVSRPRYSNTIPGSSPTRRRIASPTIRPALGCRNPSSPSSSPLRWLTGPQPCARTISPCSSDAPTATGMPPPFFTSCVANEPSPPVAPQIRTTSPCFIRAPCGPTSIR